MLFVLVFMLFCLSVVCFVYKCLFCYIYFNHRILYNLWSGEYNSFLSEHFRDLGQLHQFERDSILGKD